MHSIYLLGNLHDIFDQLSHHSYVTTLNFTIKNIEHFYL